MPDILTSFPTMVFQIMENHMVMRVASEHDSGLKEVLRGHIGETIVSSSDYTKKKTADGVSLTWRGGFLKISYHKYENGVHRYDFLWTGSKVTKLVDTIDMKGAHWYGGAQIRKMVWPMEKMKMKCAPFVTGDSYKDGEWGGVQERYWLSSKGIAVFVKPEVPLFVGINESDDGKLRLMAKYEAPYRNNCGSHLQLRYSIYHGPDIMTTHKTVCKENIHKPEGIPDISMFKLPIWSTWAICKEDVDQNKVLMLANQIKSYGINTSQLQIDDHWAIHRGDWAFNRDKFPNPSEMIRRLKEFGFNVTIWVHPFANMKSNAIKKTDLFVKGATRGAVKWWTGIGRILDITKPSTIEWYKKELSQLQENYSLKSFKFDGGEATWLPKKWSLHKECNNPNMYTKKYVELAYEMDKTWKSVEVRVGVRTQRLPIFIRMMDKDSIWGEKNGLRSIIPQALLYGIIGFPFFIPDMVGGNAYDTDRPTKSLFIRWVQVCTFMPSIQFSLPPWWFDHQTVRITKKMLALRAKYTDLLVQLAKAATETGEPIIRPLWWIAPGDDFALKCDDQFLVGNDLLVAPVLLKGVKTRPLYLPAGQWIDQKTKEVLNGNKWYFEYKVTIEDLPHFIRVKSVSVPPPLVTFPEDLTVPLTPVLSVPQSPVIEDITEDTPEILSTQAPMPQVEQAQEEMKEEILQQDQMQETVDSEDDIPQSPPPPPSTPLAKAAPFFSTVDNMSVEDSYDSPDEGELPPTEADAAEKTGDVAAMAAGLADLLRHKLEADAKDLGSTEALDDMLRSTLRGKYRFSHLEDDIDDENLAMLADIINNAESIEKTDSTVTDENMDLSDEDFMPHGNEDIEEELSYMKQQISVEPETPGISEFTQKRAPLAMQESITSYRGSFDMENMKEEVTVIAIDKAAEEEFKQLVEESVAVVAAESKQEQQSADKSDSSDEESEKADKSDSSEEESQVKTSSDGAALVAGLFAGLLEKDTESIPSTPTPHKHEDIMFELVDSMDVDLDAVIPPPPPPIRSTSLLSTISKGVSTGLYENVPIPTDPPKSPQTPELPKITEPDSPPPPIPKRIVSQKRPSPTQVTKKCTLWDELTAKLAPMPKFDPEDSI